jgi:hypothetical protein
MSGGSNRGGEIYFFAKGPIYNKFRSAVITGACRSGKTTLGNILSTTNYVEMAEEPWAGTALPLLVGLRKIDEAAGQEMFQKFAEEYLNDSILLRNANFRPGDLSSIWNRISPIDIFSRIAAVETRADVKIYVEEKNPILILNLAETLPFCSFFPKAIPSIKIIISVRKGLDVAMDCENKNWNSDQELLSPTWPTICYSYIHKGKILQLPWWVSAEDGELFLSYSIYERGLYYWCQLMESGLLELESLDEEGNRYLIVRYEDLIEDPEGQFIEAAKFLDVEATPLTTTTISKTRTRKNKVFKYGERKISEDLVNRAEMLYDRLGYVKLLNK